MTVYPVFKVVSRRRAKSVTGFCIITCRFAFSKMLYARVYMWLNVTECHRRLATPGGLSDAFLDIIHVVISQ